MLNEEQINKAGLLHKIQFAVETVDVSKFYEAIILYSMEYKCEVPTETAKLVEAQERKVSQDKLKQLIMLLYFPPISYLMPIYNCYNLSNTYFYTKNTYIKFHRTNSLTHSHSNAFLKHTNAIPFFNKLFIFLIYQSFYIKITSLKP